MKFNPFELGKRGNHELADLPIVLLLFRTQISCKFLVNFGPALRVQKDPKKEYFSCDGKLFHRSTQDFRPSVGGWIGSIRFDYRLRRFLL